MAFPESFWWGTGASSTQCEGAAPRADWARWEQLGKAPPSGDGNGFATNYPGDFALFAEHGLTHHRLSIEWARIEPYESKRDQGAIDHYTDVLRAARDAGIAPWVCLHHFTLPGWFSEDMRGFLDERGRSYYWARHVDFMAETFGDLVFGWKPINEPAAYAAAGWLLGAHPPGVADLGRFAEALRATHLANHEAWRLLRSGDKPVATVHNLSPVYPADADPTTTGMARAYDDALWNCWITAQREGILAIPGTRPVEDESMIGAFDLIGFSYYSALTVHADGTSGPYPADALVGPMGYAPWSEGLALTIQRLADELPNRPLLICEHGVGTDDDDRREEILKESLRLVGQCLDDGIDVRGFFHWTGVDNYEWGHGYDVAFGLFDRDRNPRGSAALFTRGTSDESDPA